MKVVCAWCGVVLAEGDEPVSHGLCQPCKANLEGEIDEVPNTPGVLLGRGNATEPRNKAQARRFTDSLSGLSKMVRRAIEAAHARADAQGPRDPGRPACLGDIGLETTP